MPYLPKKLHAVSPADNHPSPIKTLNFKVLKSKERGK